MIFSRRAQPYSSVVANVGSKPGVRRVGTEEPSLAYTERIGGTHHHNSRLG
ncbi:hypothetical protein [Ensifer sp. B1-9]|uniref:hypothetical protein n=1 Tax=Ensifer sp. B1-9 TaxID=3141455 RepID=UPI003D1F7CF7